MEVPRLGVKLKLQLPAYITATASQIGATETRGLTGVPIVAQWVKNTASIHENQVLIPGLTQWVKDLVLP